MDVELDLIIENFIQSEKTKKYSNKYYFSHNPFFDLINDRNEVMSVLTEVKSQFMYFENLKNQLTCEDLISLEKSMAKLETAAQKVFFCFQYHRNCFNLSMDEILQLLHYLYFLDSKLNDFKTHFSRNLALV